MLETAEAMKGSSPERMSDVQRELESVRKRVAENNELIQMLYQRTENIRRDQPPNGGDPRPEEDASSYCELAQNLHNLASQLEANNCGLHSLLNSLEN